MISVPWGYPEKVKSVDKIVESIIVGHIDTYGKCGDHDVIHVDYEGLKKSILELIDKVVEEKK